MSLGIDLFEPAFQENPYPFYETLRAEAPVYREPRFGGYLLSRYDDVYEALRDHGTYSSARGLSPRQPTTSRMGANLTIVTSDPPRHTHLRQLVNKAFTPRVVELLRPRIEALCAEFLDAVPGPEFDFVGALSYPLPMVVIAELLGVPAEDREQFKRWSDALVGTFENAELSFREDAAEMFLYFTNAYAARRTGPREDLLTALVEAEIDGERLNDIELLSFAMILLVAGNETTTNLLGNFANIAAARPDLWQSLRADRSLVRPAIEETLRIDSPVQLLGRGTTRAVELHGMTIPENARVLLAFGSANRDPDAWAAPDDFRLDRELGKHVAFGHGIHYCLGSPLARLEAEIAINALLDRFDAFELAGTPQRLHSTVIHGFERLPVSVTGA